MPEQIAPARCQGGTDERPCGTPEHLLIVDADGERHFCFNHHPDYEAARDAAREKGGLKFAAKFKRPAFLATDDLGDLATPEDAQRWSEVIARAVVTGRLSSNAAGMALKAVEQWVKAHESVGLTKRLAELEQRVQERDAVAAATKRQRARERAGPTQFMGRDST